jgi:hypothetical protein
MSLLAKTLLSLTGARLLATGSLLTNLEFSPVGGGLGVFLEPLVFHHVGVALLMLPQNEEALVLVDMRDAPEMEDVSEAGEERPDDDSE